MFSVKMPHYDESFMFDDSVNQRRNKRSYRVFKNGLHPCELTNSGEVLHTLEERGNNIFKHNIRNLKGRNRYRIEKPLIRNGNFIQCKTPEIFIHYPEASVFDPSRLYDIKNNNNILTLTPCKSFDNLTLKELKKEPVKETIRNGKSLQNLSRDESLKHFISPVEENLTPRKVNVRNSYSIEEAGRRPAQRRYSRSTAAPGVGVYRKFTGDEKSCKNLNAIKPYCSRSPPLSSAVKRLCTALAMLIRLCDEVTVASLRSRSESDISAQEASEDISQDVSSALSPEHVGGVVKGLRTAVEEVSSLAQQYMTRPALSPRPALVSPRATTQRNSLPGICNCNNMSEMRTSVGFSNESGFVSVGHSEMSTEHSFTSTFSSHHYSSHTDSVIMPGVHDRSRLASITSDESETPPELPAKTRRNIRADVQHHFPNVEIRRSPPFSVHDARPHTLAEHNHQRPPPLPLKKKHNIHEFKIADLERNFMQEIMEFIYWLVEAEELPISKALRQILVDKQKQLHYQNSNNKYGYESACYGSVSLRRDTLLEFKAGELAEQMTLLDAALFDEARERERYASKFLKVMKALRKMNNFNSYLALVSALDCPPVRRLGWPRTLLDALHDHCSLIDSSMSFSAYRRALADTQPPCIPYIGLFLQDLTFVHVGNPDLLPDGSINFTKRWQQYHIMENMKRFHKEQYKIKKNERIQAMFNEFDDVLSEETMWQ
ncbi:unnamed protein product, partial [Leptidea sinapis]